MTRIIIAGYPKSGNTWLARLTAELVHCPIKGFLYADHFDEAIEGLDRVSEHDVFKSHHPFHELAKEDATSAKIIYIFRDPRDVSISGRIYFRSTIRFVEYSERSKSVGNLILNKSIALVNRLYRFYISRFAPSIMNRRMNRALLEGDIGVNEWCKIPWKSHLRPFLDNSKILKIRYESLLSDPLKECKRVLEFLHIVKSETDILNAIDNQSFRKVKEKHLNSGQSDQANFLRKGEAQQWKTVLSKEENQLFIDELGPELTELGYDLAK